MGKKKFQEYQLVSKRGGGKLLHNAVHRSDGDPHVFFAAGVQEHSLDGEEAPAGLGTSGGRHRLGNRLLARSVGLQKYSMNKDTHTHTVPL